MEEIKNCPFCGGECYTHRVFQCGKDWVTCGECGAIGKLCNSTEEAIRLWNARAERTCEVTHKKSGPFYDVYEFPCCGYEISESRTDNGTQDLVLNYCPKCGAKVVEE